MVKTTGPCFCFFISSVATVYPASRPQIAPKTFGEYQSPPKKNADAAAAITAK